MRIVTFSLATLLTLSQLQAAEPTQLQIDNGAKLYLKCRSCHNIDIATNKIGPHLHNILNRKAGSVAGFNYSLAMREAGATGLVWDEKNLTEFIKSPKTLIPDTSMRFWGLWADQADDLVSYLKSRSAK